MSFYGSVYYQATDAIAKIIIRNSGLLDTKFFENEIPEFVQIDADGRASELKLDSGNRWIQLIGVDNDNRCSFYHNKPDENAKVCIPGISPESIEVPAIDENKSSIVYPDRETVLNVEEGVRFSMPIIYYDDAGHISLPADQPTFKQTFVIPRISSAKEIDELKDRLEIHENTIGIQEDGTVVATKGSILQRLKEAENAKTTIENFLDQETGEWPAFTQQYYQWKGSIDQFKIDYEKWKSTVDDTLLQYNIRIGRLEGVN